MYYMYMGLCSASRRVALPIGATYSIPEINASEIIVDFQWHFPMDCQWHFPMDFNFCDFNLVCNILP